MLVRKTEADWRVPAGLAVVAILGWGVALNEYTKRICAEPEETTVTLRWVGQPERVTISKPGVCAWRSPTTN